MSIYDYDVNNATKNLLPPNKRKPNNLAFLGVFGNVLQRLRDIFFNNYADGSIEGDWVSAGTYHYVDRVRGADNAIYELITVAGITGITTPPAQDSVNWIKIVDNFIGVRERAHYTSQKIMIEYALNRYFKVGAPSLPFTGASHTIQIYILSTPNSISNFWLSNGGPNALTSYLSNGVYFQRNFLGNSYTYSATSFTIYVPAAVWATLGASDTIREGVIRGQADKYVQCAKFYKVLSY